MAEIIVGNTTPKGGGIDDNEISPTKTFSSEKIDGLLLDKADKARAGNQGDILVKDVDGNPISSNKKIGDFATSEHTHMASDIPISPINFGGTLSRDITNIQEFADFVDDNIGFGRSIEYQIVGTELWIRKEKETEWTKYDLGLGISDFSQTFDDNLTRKYTFTFTDGTTEEIVIDKPRGISSFEETENTNLVKKYKITYTDNTESELVFNKSKGIASFEKTAGEGIPGTTDTYTITYTDGSSDTFNVINGANGEGAMQTISSGDDVINIDSTDPANPVISTDTYTKTEIDNKDLLKADKTYVDNQDSLRTLISDIRDNLTSTDTDKPLSANQGKIIKTLIDDINSILASDDISLDEFQEIVDFIKQNKSELDNLAISNIAGLQSSLDDLALQISNNDTDISNLGTRVTTNEGNISDLNTNKVDKVDGKQLSTKDFTAELETKLNGINPDLYAKLVGDNEFDGRQICNSQVQAESLKVISSTGQSNFDVLTGITSIDDGRYNLYDRINNRALQVWNRDTGNVGVGTDNPQAKLDVNGDVRLGRGGYNECLIKSYANNENASSKLDLAGDKSTIIAQNGGYIYFYTKDQNGIKRYIRIGTDGSISTGNL